MCQQYSLTSPTHSFNPAFLYVLVSPAGSHSFTLKIPVNINRAYTPQPPPLSSKAEVFVIWVVFFFFISKYADSVSMSYFVFPALFFHHSPFPLLQMWKLVSVTKHPRLFPELQRAFGCVGQRCLHLFFILNRECRCFIIYQVFFERVFEVEAEVGEFKTQGQLAPFLLECPCSSTALGLPVWPLSGGGQN